MHWQREELESTACSAACVLATVKLCGRSFGRTVRSLEAVYDTLFLQ